MVIPYWGTLISFGLGALHMPSLVRWIRRRRGGPDGEPGLVDPQTPKPNPEDPDIEIEPGDLTVIEGIGPAVQTWLYTRHLILTYEQLAATSIEDLREWLDAKKWDYMFPETWPLQAALMAAEREAELDELKRILYKGRFVEVGERRE